MPTAYEAGVRQTDAVISQRPEDVVLVRTTEEDTSAGGTRPGPSVALLGQRGRLLPADKVTNEAPLMTTPDGRQVRPDWMILFMPGADVQAGDTTTVRGHKLEVVAVSDMPPHRIVAQAVEHG